MIGRILLGAALLLCLPGIDPAAAQSAQGASAAQDAEKPPRQTYGEAMGWYETQARRGYPRAQYLLGYMYETGLRGAPDPAAARAWYRKAARQGEARAAFRLAEMLRAGRGGPVDMDGALRFYRLAAERGHVGAQSTLGYLLAVGKEVARDDAEAYLWLTLAARAGDAAAAENRARLLEYMTPESRVAGERLVRDYRPKG